jgi:15-cis-phytoene synthase
MITRRSNHTGAGVIARTGTRAGGLARTRAGRRADPGASQRSGHPPTLEQSYEACRQLNRKHGTTYYWSTYALPRIKRHHVHALYGFCRFADEIVDDPHFGDGALGGGDDGDAGARKDALAAFSERFLTDLAAGDSNDEVLKAVVHTVRAFRIDPELFRRFLHSMEMDLTIDRYDSYRDLEYYMDGSASVIGEMMLPILEPYDPVAAARPARALGEAFQLTNFWRDVSEDLDRGRVYIPQEDLRRFGADPLRRRVDSTWVELMRFEVARTRQLYEEADFGVDLLPPSSARCIRAARALYAGILDQIEANHYDVFTQRARVPAWQKARVISTEMLLP